MLNVRLIGERIRELRQDAGLTQSELAEILSVSFQAVSNWERGVAPPDLENLIRIAEHFGITVDGLLHRRSERLYIGIDGGGTKTELVVVSEDGYVVKRLVKSGSNPNDIGYLKASELILNAIGELTAELPSIRGVFCGIAGFSTGNNSTRLLSDLKKRFPKLASDVKTDAYNIFAIDEGADMVVISGTGSVVFVRDGDKLARIGGWGYLLDNAGSAYDMGRDAIAAALGEEDRGEKESTLTRLVKDKLGTRTVWEGINTVYEGGRAYIAEFASAVFSAYALGDVTAIEIVDRSARALAELINLGRTRYGATSEALGRGGILEYHGDVMLKHVAKYTNVKIKVAKLPPVYGAARLARAMDGEIGEEFCSSFEKTYGGFKK